MAKSLVFFVENGGFYSSKLAGKIELGSMSPQDFLNTDFHFHTAVQ